MRAGEADPLDSVHRVAGAQELAELRSDAGREIPTPRVDVLAEERDLPDALAGKRLDLGDDLAGPAALLSAPNGGNDAVGADRVAAHRDLHPGRVAPLAVHRERRREGLVRAEPAARHRVTSGLDPVAEVRDRARAERDVDEWVALEDPLALRLGVAPSHRHHEIRPSPLAGGRLAEVRRELRVRLLPDRARVEDEHVRLGRLDRLAQRHGQAHALDALRVVGVHLTPEGRDAVPAHRRASVAPVVRRTFSRDLADGLCIRRSRRSDIRDDPDALAGRR